MAGKTFGFIGIRNPEIIMAEGTSLQRAKALEAALKAATELRAA
jgi:FMN-dependent NADH-azoreductase